MILRTVRPMIIIEFGVFSSFSFFGVGRVGNEGRERRLFLLCFIFQMGLEKTQVAARNLSRSQSELGRTRDWRRPQT